MKYFYWVAIVILLLTSGYNYLNYGALNNNLEKCKVEYEETINDMNYLLNSFLDYSSKYLHSDYICLNNGDILNIFDIKENSLVYYYTLRECFPCVERDLFMLFNLSKEHPSFNITIVCSEIDKKYSARLLRSHSRYNLRFCYLKNYSIKKSEFLIINSNGNISNSYYPNSEIPELTERYLNFVYEQMR